MSTETERLEHVAAHSLYLDPCNRATTEYSLSLIRRFMRLDRSNVLELGPAEGVMTGALAAHSKTLTCVEGSSRFADDLRQRHPDVQVVNSLFEDFQPENRYDVVILGHVLEHVDDPVAIMRLVKQWLAPGGRVFSAVPNARSLHRQAAVIMGLLSVEDELNDLDRHHGHRRVFNPESYRHCFAQAGFRIEQFGGYWLKPVSNRQIDATWTPEMLSAFMHLGERYPDIAGEIYVIATAD